MPLEILEATIEQIAFDILLNSRNHTKGLSQHLFSRVTVRTSHPFTSPVAVVVRKGIFQGHLFL